MHAVVVGDLLQGVELADLVGQAVSVHLAEERGALGEREGENLHFERDAATVGDGDRSATDAGRRIEGDEQVDEDGLVRLGLQRELGGERQQGIGDLSSVGRNVECLIQLCAYRGPVESDVDAHLARAAEDELEARDLARGGDQPDLLPVVDRIVRAVVVRQGSDGSARAVVLVQHGDHGEISVRRTRGACEGDLRFVDRGHSEQSPFDDGRLRPLPGAAERHDLHSVLARLRDGCGEIA